MPTLRILAFSDLHLAANRAAALVTASSEADLVIGAGDFCNARQGLDEAMEMLSGISVPMVVVPGNAEDDAELRAAALPNMTVLHGDGAVVEGLRFFGFGGAVPETPFGDWSFDLSEATAAAALRTCEAADILVTHSPPKGAGDTTGSGLSVGSTAIQAAITRLQPQLAVFGHVHESWGFRGEVGATPCANLGPRPNWFEVTV
ncbi:Calcineurin-like phosphoesterase superfamily domain protein [Tritonibacter multivorans]|uniref:Calcineurin-like phosphoesterase superfamily domain protein n=1 Tax=Tritonibacter multivorans TaxID=928856 RepID=A0A0P1G2P1_9RHOB|nr:metallophosphoesterase [Tritonibacter multivorans]MDA7419734.1 metallophosphoesterase family protein [Tritonibacter multivorans]CUH76071.1 Calcineurin-like phosphoesterase superfamily domain protein [Tritonibacter multivorans]SFC55876.1 Predicted phosphoesterase [Tritonibacter multivorans]